MRKKLFAILLALCMTVSLLPTAAFANATTLSGELTSSSAGDLTWDASTNCSDSVTLNGTEGKVEIKLAGNVDLQTGTITVKGTNGAEISSDSSPYTFKSGNITIEGSSTLTIGSNVTSVEANIVLNKDAKLVVSDKTYTAKDNSVTLTLTSNTVSGGNITISSGEGAIEAASSTSGTITANSQAVTVAGGTVQIKNDGTVTGSTGTSVTIGGITFADNGTSLSVKANTTVEITDAKVASLSSGNNVKVGSATTITTDNSASISISSGTTLTVESGSVTVSSGNLTGATVNTDATLKVSDATYKATGGSATVDVTSSEVTLKTGKVQLGGSTPAVTPNGTQKVTKADGSGNVTVSSDGTVEIDAAATTVTVGTGKTYKSDGAAATIKVGTGEDDTTLTTGKVELGSGAKVKVTGITGDVSGDGIVVDASAKTVKIPSSKTATLGSSTFKAETAEVTLTVNNAAVTVSDLTSAKLTVGDSSSAYTVSVTSHDGVTFKGNKYKLSAADGLKVTLANTDVANMTFTSSKEVEVETPSGDLKFGETTVSGKKITGVSGAQITLTADSTDVTATSGNNYTIDGSGKVTAPAPAPSFSSPTPSTPDVTDPTTDSASGTTTVDVNTNSTTTGNTTSATVSDSNMNKAVDSAVAEAKKQSTVPVVEVNVKTSSGTDSLNVSLPKSSLETLAEAEGSSLVITSDIAEVALDNTALTALAEQATGDTVILEVAPVATTELNETQTEAAGEADVVDLSMVSNGVAIHDYNNGKITVTLPYTLAEGQNVNDVVAYYLDDNGDLTPCSTKYDGKANKVTFTTVHLSKYVIGDTDLNDCASDIFTDVEQNAWYHEGVNYAINKCLMDGTDTTIFEPKTATTRAMAVTILYRLEGEPAAPKTAAFADVPAGKWYTDAVAWAAANGIVEGHDDTHFAPNTTITREQMALILYNYASFKGYDVSNLADLSGYTDAGTISSWASTAMRWAVAEKLIDGTSDTELEPATSLNRAMLATILMRFCDNIAK